MKLMVMYQGHTLLVLITAKWQLFTSPKNHETNKDLVASTLDLALVKLGGVAFDEVNDRLHKKYHCFIADCYEHPEYLKDVLLEVFGDCSKVVIESIKLDLNKISPDPGIEQFLKVICW